MPDLNDMLMKKGSIPDLFAASKVISEPDRKGQVLSTKEAMQLALTELERPKSKRLTTGHHKLDEVTGGFEPGFVWTMGAETNFGKSSWLVSIADINMSKGRKVLIVSAEDSEMLYGTRLLLRRSRVSANDLRHERLTTDDLAKVKSVIEQDQPMPYIICLGGRPIEAVIPEIERVVKEQGIELLALDYLQAVQTQRSGKVAQDRRHEVTHVARLVTDLVKNIGISGLLLSQLTIDKQRKGPPGKYDLRESQDLANAAEVIVLGYRPETTEYKSHGRDVKGQPLNEPVWEEGQRYLCIAKNKAGEVGGRVKLSWDSRSACFDRVFDPETERFDRLHDELGPSEWDR